MEMKTGLVLEGGGMRTVFTAGVLDCFIDNNITFPYVVGVSGGACCAVFYMAGQRGRMRECMIDLLDSYHYIKFSPKALAEQKVFDFDTIFDTFTNVVNPFDFKAFFSTPCDYEIATSNCVTGEADYFCERNSPERLVDICKASSSLPVIMKVAKVDGTPMLDGGICAPVPIERAIEKGCERNVVVLTRPYGHVSHYTHLPLPHLFFHQYPKIRSKMINRGKRYNEILRRIERDEQTEGDRLLVLRPEKPLHVGTATRDTQKLEALYRQGYDAAQKIVPQLIAH